MFGIDRSSNTGKDRAVDVGSLVGDVFADLGFEVRESSDGADTGIDLVLDPYGIEVLVKVRRRALVDEDAARRLLADHRPGDVLLLVVGDRVTQKARALLLDSRAGYLDLRGHLGARTDRLVINAEVEPHKGRSSRVRALGGGAGLEVAAALLLRPGSPVAVRELARELARSPSTVSEILAQLRGEGLVDASNTVIGTDLFWAMAERWPSRRTGLAEVPRIDDRALASALRLGLDDVQHHSGWALTGSAAALAHGAPLAARVDQVFDFYVPDQTALRRATTLLGAAPTPSQAPAAARVAPVPAAVNRRIPNPAGPDEATRSSGATWAGWPLAHPLFVALDLAQDHGRGREILDNWTPDGGTRVW
jgi:DNA-binding transcriptional ArsR family regulator